MMGAEAAQMVLLMEEGEYLREVEVVEEANPYPVVVEEDSQDLGASCQVVEEATVLDSGVPSQEEVGADSQG